MKNTSYIFCLFSITFFALSCSKQENTITETLPIPPTSLKLVDVTDTRLSMSWTDVSTNEKGFKIQRKTESTIYEQVGLVNADVTVFKDSNLIPNTKYTYRVYAFNNAGSSPTYSNEISATTLQFTIPILSSILLSYTVNEVQLNVRVEDNGGKNVTEAGVCYSTQVSPTVNDSKVKSTVNDIFTSKITGLKSGTRYYFRPYAINSVGIGYGKEISVLTKSTVIDGQGAVDIDGNKYRTVIINDKEYFADNLRVEKFNDGTPILNGYGISWSNSQTPYWSYYDGKPTFNSPHGKLYNGYVITNTKNVCPVGWRVPTITEWVLLAESFGGPAVSGAMLKSTNDWLPPNSANNESRLSIVGSGTGNGISFSELGTQSYLASTTVNTGGINYFRLSNQNSNWGFSTFSNSTGSSVRCVKN